MYTNPQLTLNLSNPSATLENVGGKGMSLAKMINAGFPVPDGFHVTTEAYRQFVKENDLQTKILTALKDVDTSLPTTLETASATIGRFFADASIPEDITAAITDAYVKLETLHLKSVAVRSSATAEDLPEASFAGQQETFLNVRGEEDLLNAVKKCWASLWTARAIAYRIKNNIDQNTVALAVVVQEMVDAEAAGILFTANPINGNRGEMVINAAWGLGEAVVGGLVSPDTIVADKTTGKVKSYEVAEKTIITVRIEKGTSEEPLSDSRRISKVLNEAQVSELVDIARRIESHYGRPQDIEWCRAEDRFFIVQSRPITAMAEVPIEWTLPNPKGIYMRTSIADLMPNPLSPLFSSWAMPTLTDQMKPLCKRMGLGEPVWPEDFYTSINRYAYLNAGYPLKTWLWMIFRMLPAYPRLLRNMVPIWRDGLHPEYQEFVRGHQVKDTETMTTSELWQEAQATLNAAMYYAGGLLYATMGASAGSEAMLTQVYNKFGRRDGDPEANTLLMGWDNIPVRSEKSLYDIAMWIRENEKLSRYILSTSSHDLVVDLNNPDSVRAPQFSDFASHFEKHLEKFGHLIFQMDFAEPLPRDHPELLLETIKMYLRGQGVNPHERQHTNEEKRIQTADNVRSRLKGFKRWAFIKTLNWGQSLAEVREDALAEIGLGYPILRTMLHELGNRFVTAGVIVQVDDIYWLEKQEVEDCVHALEGGSQLNNLAERVEERKTFNNKIQKEIPPPMIPMKKKYLGIDTKVWLTESESNRAGNTLKGVPTSSGKVTAPACVLRGPEDFDKMRPGAVLVAGTTTPAWTPLFAMASAVVTDIGGPLSHGSIVAREYGIPAVMGTGVATKRIQSGQSITVDGTKGEVILETGEEGQPKKAIPPIEWKLPHPKIVLARGSFAEFVPEPVSPLFATLAVPIACQTTRKLMAEIGVTGENSYLFEVINNYVYVGMTFTPRMAWQMTKASFQLLGPIMKTAKERAVKSRKQFLDVVQTWEMRDVSTLTPSEILTGVCEIFTQTALYYNMAQSGTIPTSMMREVFFGSIYKMLIKRKDDPKPEVFVFGTENHAMRAEKALFDLAMWSQTQPDLLDYLNSTSADEVCAALRADIRSVPAIKEFSTRFKSYLCDYGHAIYDLDFAKPTPHDDPTLLIETLKVYLAGRNNPYERQHAALDLREVAAERISKRLDPLRRKWFLNLLKSAQDTAHLREDSIADLGLGHPQIRRMLNEFGRRLASNGAIVCADDIYWLEESELVELANLLENGLRLTSLDDRIAARKAKWQAMRHVIPPNTLPQKTLLSKFYADNEQTGDKLKGFAASAGKVTARACVMLGPEDFDKMQSGDVIVAGITTPAWTPLFARASAIVTDIGGPLSHSSIVAREYGIPAVLATGIGTRRIKDGQTITVDGAAGTVDLLERIGQL
jgi:phosphoenolpyruvate synthase/pyruvate phosphate dikinase